MNLSNWIRETPLIVVFIVTLVIVLASIGGGVAVGFWRGKRLEKQGAGVVGSAIAAILGLLAFILAFTFGMTASRFETRRQLLLDEVNAISTAVLRTDLLPEPHRARCRGLLTRYVNIRANPDAKPEQLPRLIQESEAILDQLWGEVVALAEADMDPPIRAIFVQSTNDIIDLHTSRVTVGQHYGIPGSVWLWLAAAMVGAMFGVGYQFGLAAQKKVLIHLLLAALFSSVVLLIADLDRAVEGTLKLDLQPMLDLQVQLNDTAKQQLP